MNDQQQQPRSSLQVDSLSLGGELHAQTPAGMLHPLWHWKFSLAHGHGVSGIGFRHWVLRQKANTQRLWSGS